MADLVHPHLAQLYELFFAEGRHFFTMELIEGADFISGLRNGPGRTERFTLVRDRMRQLAEALNVLHASGRVHCDIKSSNVLVDGDGRVVLLDFGLARWSGWERGTGSAGYLRGTIPYVAPEVLAGQTARPAGDWYSVGVLLYAALTGEFPFRGTAAEVFTAKRQEPPRPPAERDATIPDDLDRLCRALLNVRPEERPDGKEITARLGADKASGPVLPTMTRHTLPFVGRRTELEQLEEGLLRSAEGKASCLLVVGSSGVGKTALVERFLSDLSTRRDVLVLRGRCYERESISFKAWDGIVDGIAGHLASLPAEDRHALLPADWPLLVQMFPALGRVDPKGRGPSEAVPIDRQALRSRAFAALRDVLRRLSVDQTVVLFIDDLQWGDVDSAALLADLVGHRDPPSVLLIGGARGDDERTPCVEALRTAGRSEGPTVQELRLENLPFGEACALARRFLEVHDGEPDLRAEAVARQSEGNPFLLADLAQSVAQVHGEASWERPESGRPSFRMRLDALPDSVQRLMEIISVAGHPLRPAEACRAAGLEGDRLKALGLLRGAQLIRSSGTDARQSVEPYHDRIREALTGSISEPRRRDHHRQLASVLAAAAAPNAQHIAVHYHAAGERDRACEFATLAAARADESLAFDEAVRFYRLALETHAGPRGERTRLQRRLADALAYAGRAAEAAEGYLAAQENASGTDSRELRRLAAEQYLKSGHIERGYELLLPIIDELGVRLPKTPIRKLLMGLALDVVLRLRGTDYRERSEQELSSEQRERLESLWLTGLAAGVHDFRQGMAVQKRHLLSALRAGLPRQVGLGLALEGYFLAGGSPAAARRARRLVSEAEGIAHRHEDTWVDIYTRLVRGLEPVMQGRWRESDEACGRALELLRDSPVRYWYEINVADHCRSIAHFYRGKFRALADKVPGLLRDALRRGDRFGAHWFRMGYCNAAWLALDRPEEARQHLEDVIEDFPPQRYSLDHYLISAAELNRRLYCGDGCGAWDYVHHAWKEVRKSGTLVMRFFRVQMLAFRATAALAAFLDGLPDEALLRTALRDARRVAKDNLSWGRPLAALIRGQVASLRGETESAAQSFRLAIDGFDALEMAFHAAAARHRLGELLRGEDGREFIATARAWMEGESIQNPRRMLAMLTPEWTQSPEK